MITFLWAQSQNNVIGKDGKLPWKIKSEMEHFKNYTMNKTILMGRNTWEGLHVKPLPNRKNIVITSRPMEEYENTVVSSNLQKTVNPFLDSDDELVVIGGKKIFDSLVNQVDKLVISVIEKDYDGDTFAPVWKEEDFKLVNEEDFKEFRVLTYQRIIQKY